MDIDIIQLASQTATLLAPFLPYLIKGGKEAAQKAFEKTGQKLVEGAWEKTEALYQKFKPKIEAKEAAQEAVEDVVKTPDDKGAQITFERQIQKMLEKDAEFAKEISITIGEINNINVQASDNSVAVGSFAVGKDMTNSNATFGNQNATASGGGLANSGNNNTLSTIGTQNNTTNTTVVMQAGADNTKAEKAFHTYLRNLRRTCMALPLAVIGGDDDDNTTLDDVYIELDTTTPKEMPQEEKEQRNLRGGEEKLSVMDAAIKTDQLVLLGDAGSGKSTFVKELLAQQASAWLDKKPLAGFDPNLIPVLIVLRELTPKLTALDLASLSAERRGQALSNAILEKINDDIRWSKADACIPTMQEAIEQGNLLLVLDGLDEVPQNARQLVRSAVGALIEINAIKRIIITSRSRSYTGAAVFSNFTEFEVAKLDDEKIEKFALLWYKQKHRQGHRKAEEVEPRAAQLSQAAGGDNLREMASNPMMLTSIAILHHRDVELPPQRVMLYDLIVKILTSRWQKNKASEANPISTELANFINNDTILRTALERLAYEAHRVKLSESNTDDKNKETDLPRWKALELLETLFKDKGVGGLTLADEFLEYTDKRAGILVGKGGDLETTANHAYSFPHRTIQEYLAGCHMVAGRKRHEEYFNRAAEGDFWSLAGLMGAEDLYHRRNLPEEMLSLAYKLCKYQPSPTEQEHRALLWSGQIANIAGLQEIKAEDDGVAYLERLMPRTVALIEGSHLTPRERAEAGDTLAKLGDPRPGVIPPLLLGEGLGERSDFVFCEIPAGKFLMGNTKETDSMAFDNETPQFEYNLKHNYYLSRYPITNAQFDLFVADPAGYTNKQWYSDDGKKWLNESKQDKPPKSGGAFDLPNHPAVNVTWYESVAFTRWLTNKLRSENSPLKIWSKDKINEVSIDLSKWEARLPSEAEWEKAARGEKGLRYPWGNEFEQDKVNNNNIIGTTSAVGSFPLGQSPYGLLDMSGNVWEWCATQWTDGYQDYDKNENNKADGNVARVLRGGASYDFVRRVRCAYRGYHYPLGGYNLIGFRVVVAALPISLSRSGS